MGKGKEHISSFVIRHSGFVNGGTFGSKGSSNFPRLITRKLIILFHVMARALHLLEVVTSSFSENQHPPLKALYEPITGPFGFFDIFTTPV